MPAIRDTKVSAMSNPRAISVRSAASAFLLLFGVLSQSSTLHGGSAPPLPLNGTVVTVSTEAQLQAAVQNLASNTTILIAPGTYHLSSTLWINGALINVAIRGDSNTSADVILAGPGMARASYGAVPYGIWAGGNVQGLTVANLTIRDIYRQAIVFDASSASPRLHNVHVIDAGEGMVLSNADANARGVSNGVIEYSTFEYSSTARAADTPGIDIRGGAGWIVRHNLFRNLVGPSRQLAGPAIVAHGQSRDTLTEANTFINVSRGISYGLVAQGGTDHIGGIIRNNFFSRTAEQPGDAGIVVNDSPGTWVVNNTVFVSGTYSTPIEYRFPGAHDLVIANNLLDGKVWAGDGATGTASHNVEGASADMFVDAAAGDLHLSAAAIGAIDRGVATEAVVDDLDGQIRPIGAAYDVGADERDTRGRITAQATTPVAISGRVYGANGGPVSGATVTLSGSRSASTTTDGSGSFGFDGLASGGNYTVTPSKTGLSFTPTDFFYGTLASSVTAANFFESTPVVVTPQPPSGDQKVAISLTSPRSLSKYRSPAAIKIAASVRGSASVKFYANSALIGTAATAPYNLEWNNVAVGTYTLKGIATDAKGATSESSTIQVVVSAPQSTAPTPPTVTVTSPKSGSSFTAPGAITINAGASSTTSNIVKVEFFAGSTLVGTDTSSPYAATWSNVPAGSYGLTAVATDAAGASTRSSAVNVTVSAPGASVPPPAPPPPTAPNVPIPSAPTVGLTSPANGSAYSAPAIVSVAANAASAGGTIDKVEIYAGSVLIGSDTTSPYAVTWSNMLPGTYSLTAVATDNVGATTRSAAVNITVNGVTPAPPAVAGGGLVQPGNLVYQGSFEVPHGSVLRSSAGNGFDYGGMAPAFNPLNGTLFLLGHVYDQQTAELNIPAALGTSAGSLPTASVRTPFVDTLEGHLLDVAAGQGDPNTQIKGQLVYNGQLYVNPYVYYGSTGSRAHWRRSPSLTASGTLQGPFAVGPLGPDFYTGYMALVPSEWQAALGGPVLMGNCCVSEVARTSLGPSVSALDPAQFGSATVSAAPLVAYPQAHQTLWVYGTPGTNAYFNGSTQIKGVVFPTGTSSVLFIGRHGLGSYCYGDGSACNDPEVNDKGEHAYPYAYYVWAYDAHDFAAVKAGTKQPWDIRPYATWSLTLPTPDSRGHYIGGVAYDPATGRIFVSQQYGDGDYPVVHVFTVR
jgi:hypothetical protein